MSKFSVDYNKVSNSINKKAYKLEDVEHKLVRIAWDLCRFTDSEPDELWQIQNADDGSYIVAKYTEEAEETKKEASDWSVLINKTSGDVNIFYKKHPITKVAASSVGIDRSDLDTISRFLPKRLAEDKNLAQALLNYVTPAERAQIIKLYPELA